jgi:hypothetical protein
MKPDGAEEGSVIGRRFFNERSGSIHQYSGITTIQILGGQLTILVVRRSPG